MGITGEVKDNRVNISGHLRHWPAIDGDQIADTFKLQKFLLINDFHAAGHGLCLLPESDTYRLNEAQIEKDGVKVVMGPGTGLGEAFLTKSKFADCYEVYPSEGGITDWAPRDKVDFRLHTFVNQYRSSVSRVSIARVCTGPALPMIYAFMKQEHPDLPTVLETGEKPLQPSEISGKHIVDAGLEKDDALCMKVIQKFTEILGAETGDVGLQYLPYGGIYLFGGVAMALAEHIRDNKTFIDSFNAKGICK